MATLLQFQFRVVVALRHFPPPPPAACTTDPGIAPGRKGIAPGSRIEFVHHLLVALIAFTATAYKRFIIVERQIQVATQEGVDLTNRAREVGLVVQNRCRRATGGRESQPLL